MLNGHQGAMMRGIDWRCAVLAAWVAFGALIATLPDATAQAPATSMVSRYSPFNSQCPTYGLVIGQERFSVAECQDAVGGVYRVLQRPEGQYISFGGARADARFDWVYLKSAPKPGASIEWMFEGEDAAKPSAAILRHVTGDAGTEVEYLAVFRVSEAPTNCLVAAVRASGNSAANDEARALAKTSGAFRCGVDKVRIEGLPANDAAAGHVFGGTPSTVTEAANAIASRSDSGPESDKTKDVTAAQSPTGEQSDVPFGPLIVLSILLAIVAAVFVYRAVRNPKGQHWQAVTASTVTCFLVFAMAGGVGTEVMQVISPQSLSNHSVDERVTGSGNEPLVLSCEFDDQWISVIKPTSAYPGRTDTTHKRRRLEFEIDGKKSTARITRASMLKDGGWVIAPVNPEFLGATTKIEITADAFVFPTANNKMSPMTISRKRGSLWMRGASRDEHAEWELNWSGDCGKGAVEEWWR